MTALAGLINKPRTTVTPEERTVIYGASVLAMIGAAFAAGSPTGLSVWDLLLRCGAAGAFTVAVSPAKRWVWIVVSALGVGAAGATAAALPGMAALGLALLSVRAVGRDRSVGAIVGALAIQTLLRIPAVGFFGLPTLVAGAAVLVALVNGYRMSPSVARRVVRRSVAVGGVLLALLTVVFVVVVFSVRADAERGVDAARTGLAAAQRGDIPATEDALGRSARSLGRAQGRLGAWWMRPVRLVPVVGQNLAALDEATAQGERIADISARVAGEANVADLSLAGGAVDISRLTAMVPRLIETEAGLGDALKAVSGVRDPWLVGPLRDRLDSLALEVEEALPKASVAREAATYVPNLLGAERPRRYFVIFGSPAESRELGGFVGSYAVIEANAGRLTKISSGRSIALYDQARRSVLDNPAGYPELFRRQNPTYWPQNLTGLTDIDQVRDAVIDVFPSLDGAAIDGVLYLDPYALAALLEFTGPVAVEGVPEPLTASTTAAFLVRDQYLQFDTAGERFDFLTAVLDAALDGLVAADLPGPEELGRVLGPVARQGRLQLSTNDAAENAFLASVFVRRPLPEPDGQDFFSVVQANASTNKLDAYLWRTVAYRVTLGAAGELSANLRVTLRSDVPDGLPQYVIGPPDFEGVPQAHNRVQLSILTPHQLQQLRIDGVWELADAQQEGGYWRYARDVIVPPNGSVVLDFDLVGSVEDADAYRLTMANQPLVNDDVVRVEVTSDTGDPLVVEQILREDTVLRVDVPS